MHTARAGVLQLCGGGIERDDLRGDIFDLDHNIAQELQEELAIDVADPAQVARCERAYFKEGGTTEKMTVIYRVELNETAGKFQVRYKTFVKKLSERGEAPEFARLIVLAQNENDIMQFFKTNGARCDEYMEPLFNIVLKAV